jgi:hypothetical protein
VFRRKRNVDPPARQLTPAEQERRAAYDERLREQDASHHGYAEAWREFADVLLAHGGTDVVPPPSPDILIGLLTQQGAVLRPSGVRNAQCASDCHANAVRIWREGHAVGIGTGYALSDDGLWREHSWGLAEDGFIIETTADRTSYFGVEMRDDFAEWFAKWIEGVQ